MKRDRAFLLLQALCVFLSLLLLDAGAVCIRYVLALVPLNIAYFILARLRINRFVAALLTCSPVVVLGLLLLLGSGSR